MVAKTKDYLGHLVERSDQAEAARQEHRSPWGRGGRMLPPHMDELRAITLKLVAIQGYLDQMDYVQANECSNHTQYILDCIARAASLAYSWVKDRGHSAPLVHMVNAWGLVNPAVYVGHRDLRVLLMAFGYLCGKKPEHCRLLLGLPYNQEALAHEDSAVLATLHQSAFQNQVA